MILGPKNAIDLKIINIYAAGQIENQDILKLPRTYWNVLSYQAFLKRPGLSGSVLNCPKIFSGHIKMSWNIFRPYQNRQNERDCEFLMLYQEQCKCKFFYSNRGSSTFY